MSCKTTKDRKAAGNDETNVELIKYYFHAMPRLRRHGTFTFTPQYRCWLENKNSLTLPALNL
jgi:hypothetical protein